MTDAFRRAKYLVLVVLFGHLVLISAQVVTKSGATVLERTIFGAFAELQLGTAWLVDQVTGVWSSYFALRGVRDENERLRQRVADMEVRLQEERALARRSERLQLLLGFQAAVPRRTLAADVIAADATVWFHTVTINRGASDGVTKDMAVISPRGVVGRVIDQPAPHASRVQLLVDRNAAVGVLVERTRTGGIAVGDEEGRGLRLEYVPPAASIAVGDVVVTSGLDGIYPKGFVVGRVASVERSGGEYGTIRVQPAVDFSALEELLVVMAADQTSATAEGAE
ncbi:MAG: rod shape-determining protein MreC [Vicinamibacterales bacterium]